MQYFFYHSCITCKQYHNFREYIENINNSRIQRKENKETQSKCELRKEKTDITEKNFPAECYQYSVSVSGVANGLEAHEKRHIVQEKCITFN